MPAIHETAYPRIKSNLSKKELTEIYTPTHEELAFAHKHSRQTTSKLCLLIQLKVFQRLGYFLKLASVPQPIVNHISECVEFSATRKQIKNYDTSGTKIRHVKLLRDFLGITAFGEQAGKCMQQAGENAAKTKENLADIINVMIEELVRQRFELPAFSTLLRAARTARNAVNQCCYQTVFCTLSHNDFANIDQILKSPLLAGKSIWNKLKQEPKKTTLNNTREIIKHLRWLRTLAKSLPNVIGGLPPAKVKQFANEALALDVSEMQALEPHKRYTLAVVLIHTQVSKALDDMGEILIKIMQRLHTNAQQALNHYHLKHTKQIDTLVTLLREMVSAYQMEGTKEQRFEAIDAAMTEDCEQILSLCDQHIAYAGNNYYPFLLPSYKSKRSLLFDCIETLSLHSTSNDKTIEQAVRFLLSHRHSRREWLDVVANSERKNEQVPLVDLTFIPDKWRKLVTGKTKLDATITRVNRKYFELCLFTQIMQELKSGDLCIKGGNQFEDYRNQLITWEEYKEQVADYGKLVNLPVDAKSFVKHLKTQLQSVALAVDASFPDNEYVRLEKGELVLKRQKRNNRASNFDTINKLLSERMPITSILDVLIDTERWLNLSRDFGPLSGLKTKITNPAERFVITLFCYGCNMGPTQTARSIKGLSRRQIAWVNLRHVTEEKLDEAIQKVINDYNKFALPKYWGTGKSASADGTKWDVYEQNLLSEYHIRYGGYGGIGYYHVSDTYIALFSHFIPCGVYEAVYILDGLLKNESDIQPDTVHGDTQSQNAPVFGLSYLLGISLMPRIRNLKHFNLHRPSNEIRFRHIDELFGDSIKWDLIETHLPDMLRIVLSIKSGKIDASTILRRLGTYK